MTANKLCRQSFGHRTEPEYMPHLSIVYGNHPIELRQQLQAELSEELPALSEMEVTRPHDLWAALRNVVAHWCMMSRCRSGNRPVFVAHGRTK